MKTSKTQRVSQVVAAAVAVTLLVVAASYRVRRGRREKASAARALPANVHQQVSGYSFTRSQAGRQIFTVHATRTLAFTGGRETELQGVTVEVFGETGRRRDLLRTDDCEYDSATGGFRCAGKVEVELNAAESPPGGDAGLSPSDPQPVFLETWNLSFRQDVLESDAPVEFRYGPLSGGATGLEYATAEGWLDLRKDVTVDVPASGGDPALRLTAGGLRYTRATRQVRLRGPVSISDGTGQVRAGAGSILLDSRNRPAQVLLEGNVEGAERINGQALRLGAGQVEAALDPRREELRELLASGGVRLESGDARGGQDRLSADQAQLSFAGEPSSPQDGAASGNVELSFVSAAADAGAWGQPKRATFTTGDLRFRFAGTALALSEAHTTSAGKLVLLPAGPRAGERVITAGQFLMGFNSDGRLATVRGLKPAHIAFEPGPGSASGWGPGESSADQLLATLDPASENVETLDERGNVRFDSQDRHATAGEALYSAPAQTLTLTDDPTIWASDTRVLADRVVLRLDRKAAEAHGNVRSTHFDRAAQPGNTSVASDAIHVLADRMMAEEERQFVHYEGHVRAWRGDDVLESPSLDLYGRERRVSCDAGVVTSDLQPQSSGKAHRPSLATQSGSAPPTSPLTIRADRLEYSDLERRATYHGNVKMQAQDATLRADQVEVFFSAPTASTASRIERAVARGRVVVVEPQRKATAEQAEYFARDGRFVLTGGPPTLEDAEKGFATGQRLTFYARDATLLIDGGARSPALSKHRLSR